MHAWITLDKPSREHIFSHILCHCKGISLATREGFNSSRKYRNDKNIFMTHLFCSVSWSCLTLCKPMDCSMPGFPVHHQFPELGQTHVHWVGDAVQWFHPLPFPSLPAFNLSQHGIFSNESVLHIRSPKYWSFSFSMSPSNAYSGLISFRIDWLDLPALQGTLTNLAQEEQDGRGFGGRGIHLSPRIRQEYTFRHRSARRIPAESGHEYMTRRKAYIDPHETQGQTLSL